MTYPEQKQVCQLDENGFYLHTTFADLSPLEAEQGVYLLPANCVDIEPPEEKEGVLPKYEKGKWLYIADNRGMYYHTETGGQVEYTELGDLPSNLTPIPPLDEPCKWNGKTWVKDEKKRTALFTQRQTELLQRIADKTDQLKAKYLQGYSQAEIDSFYRQEREARGELPLLLLAELFEGRDDLTDIDQLKAKVIEKADLFAMVMGATFAKKQHFEKALEQAETLEMLDHIRQEIDKWKT